MPTHSLAANILPGLLLCVASAFVTSPVIAKSPERVDVRQTKQDNRIDRGARRGELTRGERAALRTQQRHIKRQERRMRRDGELSRREKCRLERRQDRSSRNIQRARHNQRRQR